MSEQYYAPPPTPQQNSSMALISLIAGILGLTLVPTLGSIAALILGYMARNQIRDSGGVLGGEGQAKAGIILGWIGVGLAVVGVCLAVAIFGGSMGLGFCAFMDNM